MTTNHEVVRSIALLFAMLDYHCKATGSHESADISNLLHEKVLPLLVEYHILRWCSSRKWFSGCPIGFLVSVLNLCRRISDFQELLAFQHQLQSIFERFLRKDRWRFVVVGVRRFAFKQRSIAEHVSDRLRILLRRVPACAMLCVKQ